jgi:hypothetical protein
VEGSQYCVVHELEHNRLCITWSMEREGPGPSGNAGTGEIIVYRYVLGLSLACGGKESSSISLICCMLMKAVKGLFAICRFKPD